MGMRTILVVDDEQELCHLVELTLKNTGEYHVFATSLPEEVIDLCQKHKPDLILLDLVMPNCDGRRIIKELKQNHATRDILIVITSGLGEMVYHEKKDEWKWEPNRDVVEERSEDLTKERSAQRAAQAYGVDDFIFKPFTPDVLRQVVSDVLKRGRQTSSE